MDFIPSFSTLALLIPPIILVIVWFLLLLIQPVCVVIDCIISSLPLTRKLIWLALMFLSLGIATTFYPYMVSESRFLRWVTIITYLPFLVLAGIYVFLFLQYPEVRESMSEVFRYFSDLVLRKNSP